MFIVIELQTQATGEVGTLVTSHEKRDEAESKFHQILTYAATSALPVHGAVMLDETGMSLRQEAYNHSSEE